MAKKRTKRKERQRLNLLEEIAETEKLNPHEPVGHNVSIKRGLYLHALYMQRDLDYASFSAVVAGFLQRHKHTHNPDPLVSIAAVENPPIEEKRVGFEKEGGQIMG
jgi:hypothetical protein